MHSQKSQSLSLTPDAIHVLVTKFGKGVSNMKREPVMPTKRRRDDTPENFIVLMVGPHVHFPIFRFVVFHIASQSDNRRHRVYLAFHMDQVLGPESVVNVSLPISMQITPGSVVVLRNPIYPTHGNPAYTIYDTKDATLSERTNEQSDQLAAFLAARYSVVPVPLYVWFSSPYECEQFFDVSDADP
jgi:hypothetical protein